MQLPPEFKNLIALSIRKQIRDYVYSKLSIFTSSFLKLKELNNQIQKEIKIIPNENFKPQINGGLGLINTGKTTRRGLHFTKQKLNSHIFTTLQPPKNSNFERIVISSKATKPISFYNEDEITKLKKKDLNNKLSEYSLDFFDGDVTSFLGKKSLRCRDNSNTSFSNVLHNKISFLKNSTIKVNLQTTESKPNSKSKHKFSGKLNRNDKINGKEMIKDNKHILYIDPSVIILSTEILKYTDYYNCIVINKKDILPFFDYDEAKENQIKEVKENIESKEEDNESKYKNEQLNGIMTENNEKLLDSDGMLNDQNSQLTNDIILEI
jgi:hypothetical protein